MPATSQASKAGFRIPPSGLFRVSPEDLCSLKKQGFRSDFAARKAVIRRRILSLVQREDPPTNLNQIIEYAMLEGYL